MRKLLLLVLLLCSAVSGDELALQRALDREIESAIAQGEVPGAVLLVARGTDIVYLKAYGEKSQGVPMPVDAVFDAASLTKPLVTAVSVLLLAEQGEVDLEAPISRYLDIAWVPVPTVRQLLTHHSGLPAGLPQEGFPDNLTSVVPIHEPGTTFIYSDVGYLLLGKLVEKVSGESLDVFYQDRVAKPLELKNASFHPNTSAVPTFGVAAGTVHDPKARALNGVAGHAGLFLTAEAVHDELNRLPKILSEDSLELFWEVQEGGRTLGLDAETAFSSARGDRFSPLESAGHTGFTGTSFWWERSGGWHVILMTSRLYPDNEGNVIPLRRKVATLVADHYLGPQVKTGFDRLAEDNFSRLEGKRVGWVLNHTSRDRAGRHVLDLIEDDSNFELKAIFTPEHGLKGVRDEKIEHGFYDELGVPIFSLYGDTRKPKEEWLTDLDVVVFDLQDVGVRFYTYISTLRYLLEVAKSTDTEVLVLDRPNPLGGEVIDGHRAEEFSFIACDSLPVVHGMTIGEVAGYLNRDIGASLLVEKMSGWKRTMLWQDTGLPFLSPSPNLAELEAVDLYPAIGQLEWCELSVGRGTRSPFRVFGAPYIKDPQSLAQELNRTIDHPVVFRPRFFIPESSKYNGEVCGGVEMESVGRLEAPAELGLSIARILHRRYPKHFRISDMARHLATRDAEKLIQTSTKREEWRNLRADYLLYE